jgi:hypothetical protein
MPALPLDEAGRYVAGAYLVFLALVLIYVAIMAARLARVERELGELAELAEARPTGDPAAPGRGSSMKKPEPQGEGKVSNTLRRASPASHASAGTPSVPAQNPGAEEAAGRG